MMCRNEISVQQQSAQIMLNTARCKRYLARCYYNIVRCTFYQPVIANIVQNNARYTSYITRCEQDTLRYTYSYIAEQFFIFRNRMIRGFEKLLLSLYSF